MADNFDFELEEIMALLNDSGSGSDEIGREQAQPSAPVSVRPEPAVHQPRPEKRTDEQINKQPQRQPQRQPNAGGNATTGASGSRSRGKNIKTGNRADAEKKSVSKIYGAPFLAALLVLMVFSFMLPLRPVKSERERRSLAAFPEFSVQTLAAGDYFSGIDEWFSDTFPGREKWLDLSDSLSNLRGISSVSINYANAPAAGDAIPQTAEIPSSSPEQINAEPEYEEEISVEIPEEVVPIDEGEEAELLEIDSDEALVEWGGLENDAAAEVTFGNVIQIDDSCYNYFTFSQVNSDRHISIANTIGDILADKSVRFFDMLVPGSLSVLLSSDFVEEIGSSNPSEALNYIYSLENDNVIPVNTFNTLVDHNDEYIYFRTDHHWTDLGAYYAYTAWCEAAGFEPVPLDAYTEVDMGDYRGSFHGKAPNASKLRDDTLIGYLPPGDLMTVIDSGDGKYVADAVRDMSNARITYKYQAFICGDNPLTVITNNDLPDAPNCLIVQDSFGNPFCVYLAQHYHKVYIVDYREGFLTFSRFVSSYDISDVILEESLGTIQGSDTNYLINKMAK